MKEALYLLGELVHQLQKTRGHTALFLSSNGQLFDAELKQQFLHNRHAMLALDEAFKRWLEKQALRSISSNKIRHMLEQVDSVTAQYRNRIIARGCTAAEAINAYSHQLISPLIEIMVEIALFSPNNHPPSVSAYNNFLQWKERVGLERAIGARGLASAPNTANNTEFSERLLFLLSEQDAYQRSFVMLASPAQKNLIETELKGPEIETLEKIHHALRNGADTAATDHLSAADWFKLMTTKIDCLKKIEEKLLDTLQQNPDSDVHDDDLANLPDKKLQQYQRIFLKTLPLFSAVSEQDFDKLLQHSQIRNYPKGKLLFYEGEASNRLYILLSGWVKIFKGTISGEEAILQILSAGNTLLESSVFLSTPYSVSAQVIEDAKLLSIPAPFIREQLRSNNDLALSMLANISRRSQFLIGEIERARLKSASERVGWFLLKLMLDQGKISNTIELPYEKSLIASYLDMKPETFSRTLKKFKEQGFRIKNDTIILPSISALCNFCDTDTAKQCERHGTPNCLNPNCKEK